MNWRAALSSDLPTCFQMEARHIGSEQVGEITAFSLWRRIMRMHAFNSTVVEEELEGVPSPVAFGASVFCLPEYIAAELGSPRPYLNSRVLQALHTDVAALASDAHMIRADTVLDLLLLAGCFRPGMEPRCLQEAQMILPTTLTELHRGYRIGQIVVEAVNEHQQHFMESSGIWQCVASFPECGRALMMMNADSVLRTPGSVSAALFQYRPPRLQLGSAERRLLAAAVHGATDGELAPQLHLSADTVKKRWRTIFDRVMQTHPALLGRPSMQEDAKRGAQKRHRILAYVRMHPEEIRPYRWYPPV